MKKRPTGFAAYDNEQKPQPLERESKIDYVTIALDAYLEGSGPCDDQNDQHVDFLSSKDIQDAIKEMVFASISTITEYMVEHGYKMMRIEGGRLVWIIKDTMSE